VKSQGILLFYLPLQCRFHKDFLLLNTIKKVGNVFAKIFLNQLFLWLAAKGFIVAWSVKIAL